MAEPAGHDRGSVPHGDHHVRVRPTWTYQPDARDAVAWDAPITWERVDDRWRILVPATLTIDPANWWSAIAEADCWCDDVAGYELTVDAVTGELVRYRPGIDCVVC